MAARSPSRHRLPSTVCLLAAAACGSADPTTTLTVTNWASFREQQLETSVAERFGAVHPGVRVSLEAAANGPEYRDLVLTSIAAGTPPDVFLLDNIDVPAFGDAGVTLDLAPLAARVGADLADVEPAVLRIFQREGRLLAFPKGWTPMVIAYNKDLFDRAGLPYPQDGWTWEEFRAAARALTRDTDGDGATDQYGFWLDRRVFLWIASLLALGCDELCADGTRASGCHDSPASVRAFTDLTDLAVRDGVTPRYFGLRRSLGDQLRHFYSGRVAMVPAGHFWLPSFRPHVEAGRLRLGFVMIPRREGLDPVTVVYASGFAVPRTVPHRRLSVALAAFLADTAAQATRAAGALEVPASRRVAEAAARADTTGWQAAFVRAAPYARAPWGARIARAREVEAVLPDVMDRIILRGEPPEPVLRDVARRLDAILAAPR